MRVLHIVPILYGFAMISMGKADESHDHVGDFEFVCRGSFIRNPEPEWNLVFKAVAGVSAPGNDDTLLNDPYQVWIREASYNEDIPAARQLDTTFRGHYKSSFALNWARRNIKEVKLALLDDNGAELMTLIFDGVGTDNTNWFTHSRLLSSPYDDILIEPKNFFSIAGDTKNIRRWYINRNHGGCPEDNGWLVTVTLHSPVCPWEQKQHAPKPNFLYSLKKTYSNCNSDESIGEASILAIFVRSGPLY